MMVAFSFNVRYDSPMNKPIIALDVDGALSPITEDDLSKTPKVWDSYSQGSVKSFEAWIADEVLNFLKKIHDGNRANIHWHTSWGEAVHWSLEPDFTLPHWESIPRVDSTKWWKFAALEKFHEMNPETPIIWIDDDISKKMRHKKIHEVFDGKCLTISPNKRIGLTPKHLRTIDDFLKSVEND